MPTRWELGLFGNVRRCRLVAILKITLLRVIPTIQSGILSRISSNILSGIASCILSGISHGILSGISSGILSGGRSPVEVQRCTLSWAGPRLRSSGAHWAGQLAGWGPAVHTELGSSQVDVQQCALSWAVGEELGDELARLARRKWRWKRRRRGGQRGGQLVEEEEEAGMRSDKI